MPICSAYTSSMKRITISVPDGVAQKAQAAVQAGMADSVSAYFARTVEQAPNWAAAREVTRELLAECGRPTAADEEWVRVALGIVDQDALLSVGRSA